MMSDFGRYATFADFAPGMAIAAEAAVRHVAQDIGRFRTIARKVQMINVALVVQNC